MGLLQGDGRVAALIGAVVLCVVLLGILLVVRARRRRVGGEEQVGDDEAMRPEVLQNLHRLEAQWDEHAHPSPEPAVERRSARRDPAAEARHAAGPAEPVSGKQPHRGGTDRRRPVLRGLLVVLVLVAALGAAGMVWASTH